MSDGIPEFASGLLEVVRKEREMHEQHIVSGGAADWSEYRFAVGKLHVLSRVETFIKEEVEKWSQL